MAKETATQLIEQGICPVCQEELIEYDNTQDLGCLSCGWSQAGHDIMNRREAHVNRLGYSYYEGQEG